MKTTCTILLLFLCTAAYTQDKKMKETKVKMDKKEMKMKVEHSSEQINYPYTAEYSSNFMPGNPSHSKLVLDI